MQMTDLMSKEQWADFEKELHTTWGVNAAANDAEGFTFTGYTNFINPLCKEIKGCPEGLQGICSVMNQHVSKLARESGKTVVEQCDAGLVKICTPVFAEGALVGFVGGCGRLPEGEEVESFAVHKTINTPLDAVETMAGEVPTITMEKIKGIEVFLETFVDGLTK